MKVSRYVITGAGGFLGKHLRPRLQGAYCLSRKEVDLCPEDGNQGKAFRRLEVRIRGPEVIVHLAAKCGGIGANMHKPAEFFAENMRMGMTVAEVAASTGAHLVFVGTTCSYPANAKPPFKESMLFKGYPEPTNAPYGVAKLALLAYLSALAAERGLTWTYLIPTNLYGPGDNFQMATSHVIPALIKKFDDHARHGSPVELWGTGTPTRDFLYVEDCADAIALACLTRPGGIINLGSGRETSIKEVADIVRALICPTADYKFDETHPDGQKRRCLDSSIAKAVLGWKATTSLEDGLQKTINWYRRIE